MSSDREIIERLTSVEVTLKERTKTIFTNIDEMKDEVNDVKDKVVSIDKKLTQLCTNLNIHTLSNGQKIAFYTSVVSAVISAFGVIYVAYVQFVM